MYRYIHVQYVHMMYMHYFLCEIHNALVLVLFLQLFSAIYLRI